MRVRPDAGSERGRIHGAELTSYSENPRGEQLPDFKRGGQHASTLYSDRTATRNLVVAFTSSDGQRQTRMQF